jgi:hypothetical protein
MPFLFVPIYNKKKNKPAPKPDNIIDMNDEWCINPNPIPHNARPITALSGISPYQRSQKKIIIIQLEMTHIIRSSKSETYGKKKGSAAKTRPVSISTTG